jgi:transcription antitermination factor NusG
MPNLLRIERKQMERTVGEMHDSRPVPGGHAESSSPWWALYTRHQHERTVADMLGTKGFDVFLPVYESVRRWKDRRKVLSLPLFPCYVFVRGDLGRRLQILSTPGIHMILSHGDNFAAVPETEIQAIRRTVDGHFRVEPHPFLRCGDRVRVKRGSLEGIEGILVRKKNVFRLVLSVEMLAQSVGVEVDAADVEPVRAQGGISPVVPRLAPAASAGAESALALGSAN